MFTFLPHTERQEVAKEYKKRLLLIYVVLVTFAGVAWIASLVPSYVLVSTRLGDAVAQKTSLGSGTDANKLKATERDLAAVREKLGAIGPVADRMPMQAVIAKLFSRIPQGITLSSITLRRSTDTVVISGIAATRDTLVSFSKSLGGEAFFKKVELPVSNFTKGKDVPFSLSLSASF